MRVQNQEIELSKIFSAFPEKFSRRGLAYLPQTSAEGAILVAIITYT